MFRNHNQLCPARGCAPWLIILRTDTLADRLHQHSHRLTGDSDITFDSQNIPFSREFHDNILQGLWIVYFTQFDHNRIKVVVAVIMLVMIVIVLIIVVMVVVFVV